MGIDASERRVGALFAEWRLDRLLGASALVATYAASRFGARAAIRILRQPVPPEVRDRFLSLAQVSARGAHIPELVRIQDAGLTPEGEAYVRMELLGPSLEDEWRGPSGSALAAARVPMGPSLTILPIRPSLPIERVLRSIERVLSCLEGLHALGVLHRGLRPAKVFVAEDGAVKVLGLGEALVRDAVPERSAPARSTGSDIGVPAYMAPEQAMGLVDQLDVRVDVFAVGAMMHALMTGKCINDCRTPQESLVMAATKPVRSVARVAPALPAALIKIVDTALQWDRRNRYASAADMRAAVTRALADR